MNWLFEKTKLSDQRKKIVLQMIDMTEDFLSLESWCFLQRNYKKNHIKIFAFCNCLQSAHADSNAEALTKRWVTTESFSSSFLTPLFISKHISVSFADKNWRKKHALVGLSVLLSQLKIMIHKLEKTQNLSSAQLQKAFNFKLNLSLTSRVLLLQVYFSALRKSLNLSSDAKQFFALACFFKPSATKSRGNQQRHTKQAA